MEKRTINIIIIMVAIIFILALAGLVIYYIISLDFGFAKPVVNEPENQNNLNSQNQTTSKIPTKEEIEAQNKINFPDILIGRIKFLDKNKTTLKTENAEYVFYPNQPAGVYKSFGIEDGDNVKVQAKVLQDNKIKWISIKKVSE
jgi:hypothetical protein